MKDIIPGFLVLGAVILFLFLSCVAAYNTGKCEERARLYSVLQERGLIKPETDGKCIKWGFTRVIIKGHREE